MAEIEVRGEWFDVDVEGPAGAPAVVLSNSLGTRLGMWDVQAAFLRRRFRVVRHDPRGFHPRSRASGDFSIEQLAQDALAILDALGIAQAHWCGVSMGGALGLWLLRHAPHRIARAVIANAGTRFGTPADWQPKIDAARAQGVRQWADATASRVLRDDFRAARPDAVQRLSEMLAGAPGAAWAGCAAALRDADLDAVPAAIRQPVLYIGGRFDLAVPLARVEQMHRQTRDSRFVALDAAHLSNIDQADAFNDALASFLA